MLLELLQQLAGYLLAALPQDLAGRPIHHVPTEESPDDVLTRDGDLLDLQGVAALQPVLADPLTRLEHRLFSIRNFFGSAVPRDPWRGELQQYVPL